VIEVATLTLPKAGGTGLFQQPIAVFAEPAEDVVTAVTKSEDSETQVQQGGGFDFLVLQITERRRLAALLRPRCSQQKELSPPRQVSEPCMKQGSPA
jgi:hypothetical protein